MAKSSPGRAAVCSAAGWSLCQTLALPAAAICSSERPLATEVGAILQEALTVTVDRLVIAVLDQQPLFLVAPLRPGLHAHQHPGAPQLLSVKRELEIAFVQHLVRVAFGLPRPPIPEQDGAGAVLVLPG